MFSRSSFSQRSFSPRSWMLRGGDVLPAILAQELGDVVFARGLVSTSGSGFLLEAPDLLGRRSVAPRQGTRMLVYPGALMNR